MSASRCGACLAWPCACVDPRSIGWLSRHAHAARHLVGAWREGVYPGQGRFAPERLRAPPAQGQTVLPSAR